MDKDRKQQKMKGFFLFLTGLFVIGVFVIIATACCELSCPECHGPDSACEECVYKPNCGSDCCKGVKRCCDKKKCFDYTSENCCNSGTGHACPNGKGCCGDKCCDPTKCESCEDGDCKVCNDNPNLKCYNGRCCCKPNGCGSCGGQSVPDNPAGCDDTSFLNPCNGHDSCYAGCDNNKDTCDSNFLEAMLAICMNSSCMYKCSESAYAYYGAVHNYGGSAYSAAQNCSCGD